MQRSHHTSLHGLPVLLCFAVMLLFSSPLQAKAREKVLYTFTGGTDGASPSSSLLMDASGHLYGTTSAGGNTNECVGNYSQGCGVVFELASSNGKWQENVLYAFQGGTDGWFPTGNLIFDAVGNIYGTTLYGGTGTNCNSGCGTVFELSPNGDGTWTKTVIHSLQYGFDGAFPAGLTADASGNLYGVTTVVTGTAYELSRSQGGTWTETRLCSIDGANPGLAFGGKNSFYFTEGTYAFGNVSEVKRIGRLWHETDLYDFRGGGNGGDPKAGVVVDKNGNLYGTAMDGGNDFGIAFELKRSAGHWKESMLYNFCSRNNCADGARPQAPMVFDHAGNLYGTTGNGGTGCTFQLGCGVVFKLAHTRTGWKEAVLYSFKHEPDGAGPTEGLTLDGKGNLYGTTPVGGTGPYGGYGTVFEVTP